VVCGTAAHHLRTAQWPSTTAASELTGCGITPEQRREAAARGDFSLTELRYWSARAPQEGELIGGEFFWIAALDPNYCE
jgi:hypothetical protein